MSRNSTYTNQKFECKVCNKLKSKGEVLVTNLEKGNIICHPCLKKRLGLKEEY